MRGVRAKAAQFRLASILLLLGFALSACLDGPAPTAQPGPTTAPDWLTVSFVDPGLPTRSRFRGGLDVPLAAAINGAQSSVDIAIHQLNLWSIRDALLEAHRRGVAVRIVAESDSLDFEELRQLRDAGIPFLGDRMEGLMHDKFVIIDRQEVWTGSVNFTTTDLYENDNNLLRIRDPQIVENYTAEFDEMFVDDRFGPRSLDDTPHPVVEIGGVRVENLFSPDDGVLQRLVELVGGAKSSVYFLAFSFTSDPLAEALIERANAGVAVQGVLDGQQARSNTGGEYQRLLDAGIDVLLDGNRDNLHHKVLIIDNEIVVTGSYNFSSSAETRNDENVLIFHSRAVAQQYLEEFERIYQLARQR